MATQPVPPSFEIQGQTSNDRRQINKKAIFGIGVTEVMLGSIAIVLAIVTLFVPTDLPYNRDFASLCFSYNRISTGVWCGLLAITTGALGIVIIKKPTKDIYISNMIMAIITAIATLIGVATSSLAAITTRFCTDDLYGFHAVIAILCVILFIMSVVHASFCCSGSCCTEEFEPARQLLYMPTHEQHPNVKHGLPVYPGDQTTSGAPHTYDNPTQTQ